MACLVTPDAELLTVRRRWTSLRAVDDFERLSAGRSALRADDLMQLRGRLDAMLDLATERNQK